MSDHLSKLRLTVSGQHNYFLDHVKQGSAVWSGSSETQDDLPDPDSLLLD